MVALLVLLVSQELLAGGDTLELLADQDLQDLLEITERGPTLISSLLRPRRSQQV